MCGAAGKTRAAMTNVRAVIWGTVSGRSMDTPNVPAGSDIVMFAVLQAPVRGATWLTG